MRTLKYILITAAFGFSITSCYDLDLEPKGLIYENVLFQSESGVKKYFALLYQDLPVEDFNYKQNGDLKGYAQANQGGWHGGNRWEAQKGSPAAAAQEAAGRDNSYGEGWGYWPYDRIRDINTFLQNFPNYKANFDEEKYNELIAEAHFLRAYYYFGMVKRYGGVPIVKTVLNPMSPVEELCLPRDTEYDCWKFIYDDLKYAMDNGSEDLKEKDRATSYAAAALMSRTMIYAGSIAKYNHYIGVTGPAVDAGLMGMQPDQAEEFFQYAYDAAKFLEGKYSLHNGSDKEKAFLEEFVEITEEDILVRTYGPKTTTPANTSLFHCWDTLVLPKGEGLSQYVGAVLQPVWELIKLYDIPSIVGEDGKPIRFNSVEEFWDQTKGSIMEPRCRATFFFPGMKESVSGEVMDIQGGVYTSYPGTASDGTAEVAGSQNEYTDKYRVRAASPGTVKDINGKPVQINGKYGLAEGTGDEGFTYTGTFIRKAINYKGAAADRVLFGLTTPWKTLRYGEVLLNRAEAAYELGLIRGDAKLKEDAFKCIQEIRERAGAKPYIMKENPEDIGSPVYGFPIDENLQFIRDERARELAFENQRLFDLRRWRVADIMFLNGSFSHTLLPYKVLDEDKYIFLTEVERFGRKVTFNRAWYYERLHGDEINKNPNLIQNDGY